MSRPDAPPIACSLSPDAIRARGAELLPGLFRRASAAESVTNGLRLHFDPSSSILRTIAATIDAERQCCRFLQFDVTVAPDGGPITLTLTGPGGTAEFLAGLVQA